MDIVHSCKPARFGDRAITLVAVAIALLAGVVVGGETATPQPASQVHPPAGEAPTDAAEAAAVGVEGGSPVETPAPSVADDPVQPIPTVVVIEVGGVVERAEPAVSPLASEGWTAVAVDDRLEPGTQIRTGLRSHVNLRFGETTVISVRSATHASIDRFYRSAAMERVRIGLAYGTVRGGSSEGPIESDVVIDSTIATLAKRGTEGWQMWVEGMTGRFTVSLAEHGLVEAIRKLGDGRSISRRVRPGEYATRDNIANMWINQEIFDRNVQFYHADSITEADAEFGRDNVRGIGVMAPGGGSELLALSGRSAAEAELTGVVGSRLPTAAAPPIVVFTPEVVNRPEGNFGTGGSLRVLLPRRVERSSLRADRLIGRKPVAGRAIDR